MSPFSIFSDCIARRHKLGVESGTDQSPIMNVIPGLAHISSSAKKPVFSHSRLLQHSPHHCSSLPVPSAVFCRRRKVRQAYVVYQLPVPWRCRIPTSGETASCGKQGSPQYDRWKMGQPRCGQSALWSVTDSKWSLQEQVRRASRQRCVRCFATG